MSIPPLVCSTPPPPDQCEEDKDPGDFDIPYNLSQDDDDDDEGFGYGDFSTYNHYQSNCISQKKGTVSENKVEISVHKANVVDIDNNVANNKETEKLPGTNVVDESTPKSDEDTNIEDLDLEINEETTSSSEREYDQSEGSSNIEVSEKALDIVDNATDSNKTPSSPSSEKNIVAISSVNDIALPSSIDHLTEILDLRPLDDPSLDLDVDSSEPNSSSNDEICAKEVHPIDNIKSTKDSNLDDDFGDFDDFQFASSDKTSGVIENCDNPWEANKTDNDNEFGNFTANFEPVERENSPVAVSENTENGLHVNSILENSPDVDDDFGDFDDFKSTAVDDETVETGYLQEDQHLPVLNFQASDSEHHVMESITKVLTSIFEVEISEPENEFEGRLESSLSETWRHLRETDIRQPYIINWNNSLGQKTLLRALCIDSRNILFGPKWGYNMPKYAVNLSAAPLQPQKPTSLFNPSQSEPVTVENPTTKSGGWTDPFTADGQESCNTESERVVEVTSTDIEVFEAAISSKSDKVYSSTINIQPLRQISLPDTHIFTPTDSEIPTSKTVHYDGGGPSVLLPQTVLESGIKASACTTEHSNDTSKDQDDDDYWEFQDFKSSSEKTSTTTISTLSQPPPETNTDNVASKPNITYQTQVLQPIKMEPLIPTVNWPDPGEIKETFDDFSDFVSNSTWSDSLQKQITPPSENKTIAEADVLDKINTKHKNSSIDDRLKLNSNEDFNDDFDTFQSALPSKHITSEFNSDSSGTNTFKNIPSQNSTQTQDFHDAFPKRNSVKSEIISINNSTRPNESLTQKPTNQTNSNIKELSPNNKNSFTLGNPMPHSMLQPIPTSSNLTTSQNKPKTGQILQPLSLESYSQINWPNPGIDLQDLSRFNPVETLQSLKSDLSVGGPSKLSSPVHNHKNAVNNQTADDDWGEFVSSRPKQQAPMSKKPASFVDDDEWSDFVSSPSVKQQQNGLNTISLNVHTNSNIQKMNNNKFPTKNNQAPLEIPTLNYITPKASGHNSYNDRHFQNL